MDNENLIPKLALALIPGIGAGTARSLMARCENAESVFSLKKRDLITIPGIGTQLADRILSPDVITRAEQEIRFLQKEKIEAHFLFDPDYPPALSQCTDAPIVIFSRGEMPQPGRRTLSIVGTRNPTSQGKQFTRNLVSEIAARDPTVIIVSGLAYGIDIQAHQAALDCGLMTIAVLGHGFHTLYPAVHRSTASRIINQGGLISDFFSYNLPEPKNFIRRNRIIAGLSEATLVIESGIKGGAMVTAEMAGSYDRDVFAVPGRPDDPMSAGCNFMIRTNQACLINNAGELMYSEGWIQGDRAVTVPQPDLFISLSEEEKQILDKITTEPILLDQVSRLVKIPVQLVSAHLLSLEFKGLIKSIPGQQYSRQIRNRLL
ncbi:MAG: DNA protecting protein DprA [Bacteroidetes bacterium GWF2_49_14]|nr:MAG: DNA protecting protein DprA [Bacteroidetes bacterium GWF2_49_14]